MAKYRTLEELRSAYIRKEITQREFIEKSGEMNMIRVPFSRLKRNNNHYQKRYNKI